jgi:hypothetical protein
LRADKVLRLSRDDLLTLQITAEEYARTNYEKTALIGDAVGWLGCDVLIAPSARWDCQNLLLFPENQPVTDEYATDVLSQEQIDSITWARENRLLSDE